ncbi:MAG: hypothetical protein M5U34_36170 [Chloroflexi bacterium]|nr:hypothetical protein [Chloroflexota bacterium]
MRDMQTMLEASRIWESKMELSQIQNLLSVAQETDSVEVVKNYIRYQIGRDTTGSSWRRRTGTGPVFGEQIITVLDGLRGTASTLAPEGSRGELEIDRIWMKMTRLYLGYLRRYFYYKKRGAA